MKRRRHFKQETTLQDRIVAWAKEVRAQAAELPPGADRDMLLKKVQQAEAVSQAKASIATDDMDERLAALGKEDEIDKLLAEIKTRKGVA